MGSAVRKPASAPRDRASSSLTRSSARQDSLPLAGGSHHSAALIRSLQEDVDCPSWQRRAPSPPCPFISPIALEKDSHAAHLSAPRSPQHGSAGKLGDSPAKRAPRHFVRRPMQSSSASSLPNETLSAVTSTGFSATTTNTTATTTTTATTSTAPTRTKTPTMVTTTVAAAAVPVSALGPSPTSLNSSCSAFSLYSAESSLRELPPLPAHLQTTERYGSASATAAGPVGAAGLPPLTPISGVPCGVTRGAAAGGGEAVASVPPAATPLPVLTSPPRSSSLGRPPPPSTSVISVPITTTAPRLFPPPLSPSLASCAPGGPPALSSFLLDMSFDSRAMTANSAAASAEIQRLGTRLQRYQRGPGEQKGTEASAAVEAGSPALSPKPPTAAGAALPPPALSCSPPLSPGHGSGGTQQSPPLAHSAPPVLISDAADTPCYYAESAKFVQVIQEMQRARDAGRTTYSWFRPAAMTAAAAASTIVDDIDGSTTAQDGANVIAGTRPENRGDGAGEAGQRAAMPHRDRQLAMVHWTPYESYDCDPMTPAHPLSVCFCGYCPSTSTWESSDGAAGLTHSTSDGGLHSTAGAGQREAESLMRAASSVTPPLTVFVEMETPPLPGTGSSSAVRRPPAHPADELKLSQDLNTESPISADASGPQLTASTANSTPSTSAESFSHCPVHVDYRPPSIYVTHGQEGGGRAASDSLLLLPLKRQAMPPGQVEVPSSATSTPRPLAGSLPLVPLDRRGEGLRLASQHGSQSGSYVRRPIIDGGTPHRRQLAKKALEENHLFFESLMKRQKAHTEKA